MNSSRNNKAYDLRHARSTETECWHFGYSALPVCSRDPTRLIMQLARRVYKDLDTSVILRSLANNAARVFDSQLRVGRIDKMKWQLVVVCSVALNPVDEDPVVAFQEENIATMCDGT